MIKVSTINRYYDNGKTEPLGCVLNNGTEAVVKYRNNNEGNLILINEFVSYQIARKIGLNVPLSGICILDADNENKTDRVFDRTNYGLAFYSTFVNKTIPFNPGIVHMLDNITEFPKMVLFDHIVYNKDRHGGNILITMTKPALFYPIDHSNVFKHEAIWDANTFRRGMAEKDYLDREILNSNRYVYEAFRVHKGLRKSNLIDLCTELKSNLTEQDLAAIKDSIPVQWVTDAGGSSNIEILFEYLNFRIYNLDRICEMILEEGGIKIE